MNTAIDENTIDEAGHFKKGLLFLLMSSIVIFFIRLLSTVFSTWSSSVFAYFGGFYINYTATFFFLLGISAYNFRLSFRDERFRAALDLINCFIWIFSLFLLFFPTSSNTYQFIHIPLIEFTSLILASGIIAFMKPDAGVQFYFRLCWRTFIFFYIPLMFFIYAPKIGIYILQLILILPFNLLFFTIVTAVMILFFISLFMKKGAGLRKILIPVCFAFFSLSIFILGLSSGLLVNIQRFILIMFSAIFIPPVTVLYKNSEAIYQKIKNRTGG